MFEEFEQWADKAGVIEPKDKALALMAWNASFENQRQKIAMLHHELMQTRHELASCETILRSERQERAK